jgi:hypothetical protein
VSATPASRARRPEHRGIEGHRWSLHRSSGAGLPCRVVCQCGWVSSAGEEEVQVLLQLKGHLEDCLAKGARLIGGRHQPPPDPPSTSAGS